MAATGVIYSLVSRGHQTILSDFSAFSGNFPSVATDVLHRCNLAKTFGQFATANYVFFTFVKQGFVFLVMVDPSYEVRIAVSFLKKVQQLFFTQYNATTRNNAISHSLKQFKRHLQQTMSLYSDRTRVDKLSELRNQLNELQQISLKNMDKVIDRGQKIQVLVKKSEQLSEQSIDLYSTANKVKNRMWWKNKKIIIGIIVVVLIVISVIVAIIIISSGGK